MQIIFLSYIYPSTLLRSVVTVHAHFFNLAVSGEWSKGTSFGGGRGRADDSIFVRDDVILAG